MSDEFVTELLVTLERAVALLRKAEQTHWASWLDKDRKLIEAEDFYGIEHLLIAFGGSGSLNDVQLADSSENAELSLICTKLYEICSELRRERMSK